MRIVRVKINDIEFDKKEYNELLKQSIERIGLSFPIKVKLKEKGYECIDGHKRLTILKELNQEEVNVVIVNNGNARSNDCWRDRNYH